MMKMKRSLSILLAIVMVCALIPTVVFAAATATFTFSGANQVSYGKEIDVTVKLTATEKISSWKFAVKYDTKILEYVEGGTSEKDGLITFEGKEESASSAKTSFSATVTFRPKKVGEVTLSIQDAAVNGFTEETPAMTVKETPTKKVSVVAARNSSDDNTLESITVSKGELKPKFDAEKKDYTVTVPYETTSIKIEAKTKDVDAKVSVSALPELAIGDNKFEIEVIAEDGTPALYTVTVTREDSELAGVTVEIDGTTYTVAYDPTKLSVPAGYKPKTVAYGDKQILVFVAPKDVVQIAYLTNEGKGAWFVYNAQNKSFSEFLSANVAAATFVVLTPSEDVKVPEGFLPFDLKVGEQTWPVYKADNSEKDGIWLVYAMNADGESGFYFYDSKLATFSSYYEPIKDKKAEEAAAKELSNIQSLLVEAENKADKMETMFLGAAGLAALLLLVLIITLSTKKKKIVYLDSDQNQENGSKKGKKQKANEWDNLAENDTFKNPTPIPEVNPIPTPVQNPTPAPEEISTAFPPVNEQPRRRRAVRSLDEVGRKEAAPAPVTEPKPAPESAPAFEPRPEYRPEPKIENKPADNFNFDDMPPILK